MDKFSRYVQQKRAMLLNNDVDDDGNVKKKIRICVAASEWISV
jgi:hypothetical protein